MTKLNELIAELCPSGVEYKTLGELGKFYGGLTGKNKSDFADGNAKFITYMNVYKNLKLDLNVSEKVKIGANEKQRTLEYGDVVFTGSSETPEECGISSVLTDKTNEKLYLNSFCICYRFNDKELFNPEFSKYLFRSDSLRKQIVKTASGVTRFNVSKEKMKKVVIPVPPLAVQEEIVRILDKFTSLTAELTAELTARRAQYEYYRDALLTPPFSYGYKEHTDSQVAEATTKITSLQNATKSHLFEANLSANRQDGTYKENVRYSELVSASSFQQGEVQMKKLGEICLQTQNIKWKDEKNEYQYIDLTSVDRENHSITETSTINASNAPSRAQQIVKEDDVLFGTTRPMLKRTAFITKEFNNQICSTGFCVLRADKGSVNPRYIYHQINSSRFYQYVDSHQQGASYPSISDSDVKRFQIPLPPLPVQKRIVDVLDNFDAICSDLKIGLPAEIDARKKQYEYYRDLLLTFAERGNTILTEQNRTEQNRTEQNRTEQNRTDEIKLLQYVFGYAVVRLGDVAELYAGATPSTSKSEYWENGTIPWMSSGEVNLGQVHATEKKITKEGFENCSTKMVPTNTVVIALAGQGKTRGTVAITRIPLCTNQSLCSVVTKDFVNSYYLYFYLKGQYQKLRSISSGNGTRGGLSLKILKDFEFPLPPLSEQNRIVKILDRFDSLCNDISAGLPAEIEKRKKQYEYYRDKLLSFRCCL